LLIPELINVDIIKVYIEGWLGGLKSNLKYYKFTVIDSQLFCSILS